MVYTPYSDCLSSSRPTIGLVLSAGGVRGCAHAGVVKTLREAGVPIDVVVGSSVGSIFGLGVAAGVPTERIAQVAQEATALDLFRFYAARLRTNARNPIARLLLDAGDGKEFSDLPLPFAVVATDVETGQPTVIDEGPVLPAIQASIALPFIARPVSIQERYYLDGGMFDTAPVHVARQLGADRVIAVCLGNNYAAPAFLRRRPWTRSVLEQMGRQRRPVTPRLRDQLRFGCRLYASTFNPPLPAQDADLAIWPEFQGLSPNSMRGARYCYEQGMKAAREVLPVLERWAVTPRPSGYAREIPVHHPTENGDV